MVGSPFEETRTSRRAMIELKSNGPRSRPRPAEGVEVVLLPVVDVLELHDDYGVAVVPALLVEEPDRMADLVDDAPAHHSDS